MGMLQDAAARMPVLLPSLADMTKLSSIPSLSHHDFFVSQLEMDPKRYLDVVWNGFSSHLLLKSVRRNRSAPNPIDLTVSALQCSGLLI